VFVVGDIGNAPFFELEHIAQGGIRMRETEGCNADLRVDFNGVTAGKFAEIDLCPEQVLHLDWEKRVLNLVLHQLDKRIPGSGLAINYELILRSKRGREEWQPLNMIPVRVR
jgi:hypothetical protein